MSNMVKYGHYFIAASIAVTGVVWLFRPDDPRIKGEDYAALFETCQNALVIPYLTGEQTPDWEEANRYYFTDYPSNSIYSTIRYTDILKLADRSRYIVARPDGSIFWTQTDIDADTFEVAVSHGGYATAQSSGILVDSLNAGGYNVTNYTYTFSTNSFSDSFVTTATRLWQTNSQFETVNRVTAVNGPGPYQTWAKTNLPLANLVYGRGAAIGLTNSTGFQTPGSWWPFLRSYSYPWEQWNTKDRSRVYVSRKSYDNVAWTNLFVSTNIPSFSATALATGTNIPAFAGYSISTFVSPDGSESEIFCCIRPPSSSNGIYIGAPWPNYGVINYVTNDVRSVETSQGYYLRIWRRGAEIYSAINYATVYGPEVFIYSMGDAPGIDPIGGGSMSGVDYVMSWLGWTTNELSVVKLWVDNPAVSPIYVALSTTYSGFSLSNNSFVVSTRRATTNAVSGTINVDQIPSFMELDDTRITTNKLNAIAHVLTHLNRTVYIGPHDMITATNQQAVARDVSTNYPSEYILGQPGETPTYYSGYDRNTQIDEIVNMNPVLTTNNWPVNSEILERVFFQYVLNGRATIYTNYLGVIEYDSVVNHTGYDSRFVRSKYPMTGCSVTYPSVWAITNGYVKRVQVYAAVECIPNLSQPYINETAMGYYTYSHTAGGEYWNQGNYGITWSNGVINAPSVAIESGRTTGLHRVYTGTEGNFRLTDKAVFTRIYDISNPTNAISFDLPAIATSLPDFKARFAYLNWKTAAAGARNEGWYYDHSVGWEIRISRVMIVVDWTLDGFLKE